MLEVLMESIPIRGRGCVAAREGAEPKTGEAVYHYQIGGDRVKRHGISTEIPNTEGK